jgi:carbamoyltransferase
MKILGFNHDMYISSAALVVDGAIVAACAEERLTRQKRTRAFPINAIRFCLEKAGLQLSDLNGIANSYNPGFHLQKFNPIFSNARRARGEYLYSVLDHLFKLVPERECYEPDYLRQVVPLDHDATLDVYYVTHHLCHAANAFYMSPFKEAAILTADGRGEHDTVVFAAGRQGSIKTIKRMSLPQSLGSFYSSFTAFLGFTPESDEWKVMALASMADPDNPYYRKLRHTVALLEDGTFRLDTSVFKEFIAETPGYYSDGLLDLLGPPRHAGDPIDERHRQIAAAMQRLTEETLAHMMAWLNRETGLQSVCVSGGLFMNSVFNGKITQLTPFKQAFISSCPDDSGVSIGAALHLYHQLTNGAGRRFAQVHNYYGPAYSSAEVEDTLKRYRQRYRRAADVTRETAQYIADGKLVGWFQGASEFGQRALGNRSILADPRKASIKDAINAAVKYREAFRPFAPAVLEEAVETYFEIDPGVRVPFMEQVYPIRAEKRSQIPAVTHYDGSGRLQTVNAETNPRFHALISAFRDLTGVPVLLNTSFNVNGEPIVCSPSDAIRTFHSCGLDLLVMEDFIVEK